MMQIARLAASYDIWMREGAPAIFRRIHAAKLQATKVEKRCDVDLSLVNSHLVQAEDLVPESMDLEALRETFEQVARANTELRRVFPRKG